MARALIVGCGCRGRELGQELLAEGWAVRGTSRSEEGLVAIESAGIEPALADPDRPGTILELVNDVAVLVLLLGNLSGSGEELAAVHGPRLERLMEHLVETPVRGVLYEGTEGGAGVVEAAGRTWRIPVRTLSTSLSPYPHTGLGGRLADEVKALLAGPPKELNSDGNSGNCEKRERSGKMALQLGDVAPDFEADTTQGRIKFHEWLGDSWGVLFSHPKDFTPVCTTELGYMARIEPEFEKRGVKIIGLSVDPADKHEEWANDIAETQGARPEYPLIGDPTFEISKAYGMLAADVSGDPGDRTPADNQTVRNVFVIGPDKKIKLILVYPMTTGRNFDEVLRVIDSLQLTANNKVATPAQWNQGDDVIISGSVKEDEAKELWPEGWESPKPYIRIVPDPSKAP
jgi:alkyl hydroperoxide reductase subunit AhpC